MRNICLVLAYDGTGYAGFQRQADRPSIQSVLEECLARLTGEETRTIGAGRTDAGVHALGQVVNFRTEAALPTARFVPALNSLLPPEIAVLAAREVPAEFNARYHAVSKTYAYRIWQSPIRPVFERNRAHHVARPLSLPDMQEAAGHLLGEHDFACFRAAGSSTRTSVRRITEARWCQEGELLTFTVTADGFLYRMVRNIVGTMLLIGMGKRRPDWIGELLAGGSRAAAGPTAPACGLFLVKVDY